jgi:hypothetical protein
MRSRLLVALVVLFAPLTALAQAPGDEAPVEYPDTTWSTDTGYVEIDTGYANWDDGDIEMPSGESFGPGGGIYGGPTFEVTTLDPRELDRALDGDIVLYGGRVFLIISGWIMGGEWVGATLYDLSPSYDEFSFSYGGFITGYDLDIYDGLSIRGDVLIGGGDLNMVKKRPDLRQLDTAGTEILERYRSEGFFALKPGISLGYAPLPFLDLRFAVSFLYPIGGSDVADLKSTVYGLHVMLGFGK